MGVEGCGDVGAYNILKDCSTELELYNEVLKKYNEKEGENAVERLHENMNLLYMIREVIDGSYVHWKKPD